MTMHRVVAMAATIVVTITAIAGLYLSGSPAEQRLLRMDERRIRDLNQLANAVQRYWQEQGALPATLQELLDGRRLLAMPLDPDRNLVYEYLPDATVFRLCAEFDRPSRTTRTQEFWTHPAGRHCFEFDTAVIMPPGRPPAIRAFPLAS
jgi:hypothetical protein